MDKVVINGNITTKKCSTNGKDIVDITKLVNKEDEEDIKRTKKFNNFYVVLEGNTLQAANRVTIYKSYKYYVSRIVLSKARGANGQDVAIFDGYQASKTIIRELPTAKFKYGSLLVVKEDKNTFRRLANVGFKIKNTSINKWIKKDSNGISYVDKEENATEFKTNSNGERKIINLRAGKYQIC